MLKTALFLRARDLDLEYVISLRRKFSVLTLLYYDNRSKQTGCLGLASVDGCVTLAFGIGESVIVTPSAKLNTTLFIYDRGMSTRSIGHHHFPLACQR